MMLIGPFAQPVSSFAKWKARGCNALFWNCNDVPKPAWELAANDAGMSFYSAPGSDVVLEARQQWRLGWVQPDEPDMPSHVNSPGSRIKDLAATYQRCHDAGKPVLMNCMGQAFDNIYYDGTPHPGKTDGSLAGHRADTGGYMAWADQISFDYHLWTTGRPGAFDITKRLMDRAWQWSGNKPIFVYVETCTQGTGKPFTADDYEAQVNNAVDYAKLKGYTLAGLIYFATQTAGSFSWPGSYDVTPPDVAERMIAVHNRLLGTPTPPLPGPLPDYQAQIDALASRVGALEAWRKS